MILKLLEHFACCFLLGCGGASFGSAVGDLPGAIIFGLSGIVLSARLPLPFDYPESHGRKG